MLPLINTGQTEAQMTSSLHHLLFSSNTRDLCRLILQPFPAINCHCLELTRLLSRITISKLASLRLLLLFMSLSHSSQFYFLVLFRHSSLSLSLSLSLCYIFIYYIYLYAVIRASRFQDSSEFCDLGKSCWYFMKNPNCIVQSAYIFQFLL